MRLNLSAFYSDYKDIQKTVIDSSPEGVVFTLVQNAAKGEVYGGEAELNVLITDNLRLGATAGFLKTDYITFVEPGTGADRSDELFDFSPEFTGSLTAVYTKDLSIGELLLRADYTYVSEFATRGGLMPELTNQDAYGLLNARAALTIMDGGLELAAFARNITKTEYINESSIFAPPIGTTVIFPGLPRTYGASATIRF